MEPLFENSFDFDAKTMREYLRARRKNGFAGFLIFCAVCMTGVFVIFWVRDGRPTLFYPAATAVVLATYFVSRAVIENKDVRAHVSQTGGRPMIMTRRFFEDELVSTESPSGAEVRSDYGRIDSIEESDTLMILKTNAGYRFVLRKDSFTKGNAEDFGAFIREKIAKNAAAEEA